MAFKFLNEAKTRIRSNSIDVAPEEDHSFSLKEKFAKYEPLLEHYFGYYQSWFFNEKKVRKNHFDN